MAIRASIFRFPTPTALANAPCIWNLLSIIIEPFISRFAMNRNDPAGVIYGHCDHRVIGQISDQVEGYLARIRH